MSQQGRSLLTHSLLCLTRLKRCKRECPFCTFGLLRLGHLAEVGYVGEHSHEAVEQLQVVRAHGGVFVHDHDVGEEVIDGPAQGGELGKCGRVIVGDKGVGNTALGLYNCGAKGAGMLVKQRLVDICACLCVAQVVCAGIGGGQIVERLLVVRTGAPEHGR